ncbi:MAG: hypothetical protein E7680_05555 [Ruminococcaceae bacterium]|nr:hypothetical protein [Oscillospiraceae bacterium]
MKKKILLLVLSVVCLAALLGVVFVANADETPETTIAGHNLSLDDSVQIIYYVDQTAPEGAEVGVLCWYGEQESYTLENKQYQLKQKGTETISGKTYAKYVFPYVAAKMMTTDIYAVSYVKVGDEVTYSALDKYSVLQYCYNKKGSTTVLSDGTATLGELVTDILNYGATAQKYFGYRLDRLANATYYQIKVENGTLADGTTKGLYHEGEQVQLKAPATSNDIPFARWENSAGENVGTTAELTLTAPVKAETYTAKFETVSVSTEPNLVVENKTASAGSTVKVAVSLENNPGFLTMALTIAYDSNAMTLTKVSNGSDFTDYMFTAPKNKKSGCTASWYATDLPDEITDGTVLTLTFQILDDAGSKTYDVIVSNPDDGGTVDGDKTPFTIVAGTGHITVN